MNEYLRSQNTQVNVETEVTESTRAVCGWNVFSGIRKRNGEVWKRGAGADWKHMSEEEQKWFYDKAVQVELAKKHGNVQPLGPGNSSRAKKKLRIQI